MRIRPRAAPARAPCPLGTGKVGRIIGRRTRSRAVPTLREAFDDDLAAGPARKDSTPAVYHATVHRDLGDWLDRSLETIGRRNVEQRFQRLTEQANRRRYAERKARGMRQAGQRDGSPRPAT